MVKIRRTTLDKIDHIFIAMNTSPSYIKKQVARWATIAHHGASNRFGDAIIYDAQRQVTLNLKQ